MAIYLVNTENSFEHNVKSSVMAGAVAAGVQTLLLPSEAKSAIKNTILGEDKFVKNTQKDVENFVKATGEKIDIQKTVEQAKATFPEIKQYSKNVLKSLGGTFSFVALSIFACRMLEEKLFNSESK